MDLLTTGLVGAGLFLAFAKKSSAIAGKTLYRISGVQLTWYYLADLTLGNDVAVKDFKGGSICTLTRNSYNTLRLEGSGVLPDGRIVGYVNGSYWSVDQHATGVGNRKLTPFASVAVDPRLIPLDSSVYISEMNLWTKAHDVGAAIKGKHIDLYVGRYSNRKAKGTIPESVTLLVAE